MKHTLFAKFDRIENAVKAGGALLDHGVRKEDFDLLAHESHRHHFDSESLSEKETKVAKGITTTSSADALEGAKKGGAGGLRPPDIGPERCGPIASDGIETRAELPTCWLRSFSQDRVRSWPARLR